MAKDRSPFLDLLRNRIDLTRIPFTARGSRLLVLANGEGLAVRLAERWYKRDRQLSSYRQRDPVISALRLIDGEGRALDAEVTTYPHRIDFRTRPGVFTLAFVDAETLLLSLPAAACGVSFRAAMDDARRDRRGGVLSLLGEIRRSVAYTTNARIVRHETTRTRSQGQSVRLVLDASEGGRALLLNVTPRLGFNRWVPDPTAVIDAAAARWHDWFTRVPEVTGRHRRQYYYAWWVLRAGLISPRFYVTREAMTPSKIHYVGIWQWDACFHAIAYRHVDVALARDQLRIVLDHQQPNGMLPDAVHDEGTVTHLSFPVDEDVTKPPVVAWATWKVYEARPDREFLDEVYESLVRSTRWWLRESDRDGNGLCEYHHPFSSGLDDSPLWDSGMPVESPDLNSYLCMEMDALARIAGVLGLDRDAARWERAASAMARRMLRLRWDRDAGLFRAVNREGEPIRTVTPFNLFPLITGRMPPDVASRLAAHLADRREFWPRYPVPTVSLADPAFNAGQMWRGPVWVNVNYMLIEGLERSGFQAMARALRDRTLELVSRHDDIYEYYNPRTGERPASAAPVFGWSAALFADLVIQASRQGP